MSEEKEEGGIFQQLKTQIITGSGIILTGLGAMFMDEVKSFVGLNDEESTEIHAPAQQQQNVNVSGPEIVINVPEQNQPTVTREIIREVPTPAPVTEAKPDTVVVEPPSARDRLLNRRPTGN